MFLFNKAKPYNNYGACVQVGQLTCIISCYNLRVTVDDLSVWEEKYGKMPRCAVAIMNSGWSSKYPNKTLVFGTPQPSNVSSFHFPGWHEDAVTWMINKRQINAVGVDTPSTDYGQTTNMPCHVILGQKNIVGIENVANLDNIPESGSTIYIPVLNIFGGSGGPARVFATFDDDLNKTNAAAMVTSSIIYVHLFSSVFMCTVVIKWNIFLEIENLILYTVRFTAVFNAALLVFFIYNLI